MINKKQFEQMNKEEQKEYLDITNEALEPSVRSLPVSGTGKTRRITQQIIIDKMKYNKGN